MMILYQVFLVFVVTTIMATFSPSKIPTPTKVVTVQKKCVFCQKEVGLTDPITGKRDRSYKLLDQVEGGEAPVKLALNKLVGHQQHQRHPSNHICKSCERQLVAVDKSGSKRQELIRLYKEHVVSRSDRMKRMHTESPPRKAWKSLMTEISQIRVPTTSPKTKQAPATLMPSIAPFKENVSQSQNMDVQSIQQMMFDQINAECEDLCSTNKKSLYSGQQIPLLCRGYKHNKMAAFRKKYSRIAELRSFLKSSTPLFVLTATVSLTAKTVIINGTGLTNYNTVELSPERSNIRYSVVTSHAENVEGRFSWLVVELEKKRNQLPKIIVFCKLISNCSAIHMALSRKCEDLEKHIAIFHSVTHDNRKKEVLDDFVKEDGQIRILLCTSAFGMGVDIPNIHTVIHYGPSRDIDDYFQESGRVGRNGEQSHAILLNYKGRGKGTFNNDMKQYLSERHQCRRQILLKPYGYEPSASLAKHDCCDVCSKACECGQETCRESNGWAEKLFHEGDQGAKKTKTYKRNIS